MVDACVLLKGGHKVESGGRLGCTSHKTVCKVNGIFFSIELSIIGAYIHQIGVLPNIDLKIYHYVINFFIIDHVQLVLGVCLVFPLISAT